jgi:hypothetical protein
MYSYNQGILVHIFKHSRNYIPSFWVPSYNIRMVSEIMCQYNDLA